MHRRDFLEVTAGLLAGLPLAGPLSREQTRALPSPPAASAPLGAAAYDRERRTAATPQGDIAYLERGEGKAALFLHGFPLSGFQWRGVLAPLSAHRRCIAPDFMGMGHTRVAKGQNLSPGGQAAMLVALLDRLAIPAADLVANDSGAAVAQLLVARHPERVRSLLLTNGDSEHDCPPAALRPVIELARAGTYADTWLAPWRADTRLARSARGIGGMCYADPAHPTDEAIEAYFAPILASPERKALIHAFTLALEANALAGVEPALRRFKGPVRIVWGAADTLFSPATPAYFDRTFRHSLGVRRLEGSRLFWPEERPEVIIEEARSLWAVA